MLTIGQRRFASDRRYAILATVSRAGRPRLVPVCFVLSESVPGQPGTVLYSPLDEKPKRDTDVRGLARVRDITERPTVTLLFEHWSEDWDQLAWLRVEGLAAVVEPAEDAMTHRQVVDALRLKYPQYRHQRIDALPLIRVVLTDAVGWRATGG